MQIEQAGREQRKTNEAARIGETLFLSERPFKVNIKQLPYRKIWKHSLMWRKVGLEMKFYPSTSA